MRGEGGASGRFSKNSWDLQDTWPSPCLLQKQDQKVSTSQGLEGLICRIRASVHKV